MDRKKFIRTTGLGLGTAFIPGIVSGQDGDVIKNCKMHAEPKIVKDSEGKVLNVIGDIQTHKLAGSDTGNQITEWVDNVAPGVGIPTHVHTKEDEIFRIIKGQVELTVGIKTTLLNEGDVVFAPKNVPHSWKAVGIKNVKMMTSAFPAGIEHMFYEVASLPPGPPNFDKVFAICAKHGISFL